MIEACAESGAWRKALRMFKALVEDPQRLRPNGSTYKALTKVSNHVLCCIIRPMAITRDFSTLLGRSAI